jgi:hypothetical protein
MRTNMNTNDLFKAISEMNLDAIKMKLMHVQSGEGWSQAKADAVEKEYRRFLCLMKLYPNEDTAPLVDVDTFWHYHILDTMKYAADCERVLGGFLHHYPYVGMRGEADQQFRIDSGERMRTLYESTFKEAYPGSRTSAIQTPYFEQRPGTQEQTAAAAGAATAWCAGPHDRLADGPATKFGKLAAAAEGAVSGATAWCAGPHDKVAGNAIGGATAWCAGPHGKDGKDAVGGGTAWCAGPHDEHLIERAGAAEGAVSGGTAWCAGPHVAAIGKETAWCAGPHGRQVKAATDGAKAATAARIDSETAWCAGPHGTAVSGSGRSVH